jgi:hypothetical protein
MSGSVQCRVSVWVELALLSVLSALCVGCLEPPAADPKVSGVGETTISKNPTPQEVEKMRQQRMPPPNVRTR